MLTVESCLCFTLETGGLVIGWFTLIGHILALIGGIILLILLCVYSCADLAKSMTEDQVRFCNAYHGVGIGVAVVVIVLSVIFAYIGWRCIQGTKARDHFGVRPMLILAGIATVMSALQIFTFTAAGIVNALIETVIYGYCFVVLYSLYVRFRNEFESGGNRNPNQYAGKV